MRSFLAALVPYRGWRRSQLGLLAALALLVAFPVAAQAATVYVDMAGTDTGSCGAAPGPGACRTLAGAVAIAAGGDTIQFGCVAFGSPPGQPLKVITVDTSRRRASSSVWRNTS